MAIVLKTIRSGGQTGADHIALVIARAFGYETKGIAPQCWRIQTYEGLSSSNPGLSNYGLIEHSSWQYPPRTIENVLQSDGTLWIGYEKSPGGKLTIETCLANNKPVIVNPLPLQFIDWLDVNQIVELNVAGNSFTEHNPNIEVLTAKFLIDAFVDLQRARDEH